MSVGRFVGQGVGEGQGGVSCGLPEEQEISCGLVSECGIVAGQGAAVCEAHLVEGEEVETLARAREKVLMREPMPRALWRLVLQATRVLDLRAAPWI